MRLAAVIINTLLVALSSFATATAADRVMLFLMPPSKKSELDRDRDPQELVLLTMAVNNREGIY